MKESLIEILSCPRCASPLQITEATHQTGEIWAGTLQCRQCQHTYPIHNGMPLLYLNNETWQPKAVEAQGWVTLHKNQGIYEVVENSVDLQIPYYPQEPWIRVARSFKAALGHLKLTGQERILDLGAGRGWASKEFAKLGCQVVALDVVPDENVGLGRAWALMTHAGVYFDRLIADGENLPFLPESFDLVFCSASLHHSAHLGVLLQNIQRVLKKNGRLCAIEPCLSVCENEAEHLKIAAAPELAVGIIETRPNLLEYDALLAQAQLQPITCLPMETHDLSPDELKRQAYSHGITLLPPSWKYLMALRHHIKRFFTKRYHAWKQGWLLEAYQFLVRHRSIQLAWLTWVGGELLLIATKNSDGTS